MIAKGYVTPSITIVPLVIVEGFVLKVYVHIWPTAGSVEGK